MRIGLPTFLLASGLGLAACAGTNAPFRPDAGTTGGLGARCSVDPDCAAGEVCVNGRCQTRLGTSGTSTGSGGTSTTTTTTTTSSSTSTSGSGSTGATTTTTTTTTTGTSSTTTGGSTGTSTSTSTSSTSTSGGSTTGGPDAGAFDAGPPASCSEAFDAGSGPFTYDGGTLANAFTVRDIQDPSSARYGSVHFPDGGGGRVTLYGAITTTTKTLVSDGGNVCTVGAWVSDPSGGAYSGVLLVYYAPRTGPGACNDNGTIPDDLQQGEALKVTGYVTDFCLDPNTFQRTWPCPGDSAVTEVKVLDGGLERLGTAPRVAPTIVDPSIIGTMDAGSQNATYDGVLLQVRRSDGQKMSVTDDNPDRPAYYGNWVLEDHLWAAHQFHYYTEPALGTQYQCVTGVFYFKDGNWKVEPRTDRDLAPLP